MGVAHISEKMFFLDQNTQNWGIFHVYTRTKDLYTHQRSLQLEDEEFEGFMERVQVKSSYVTSRFDLRLGPSLVTVAPSTWTSL